MYHDSLLTLWSHNEDLSAGKTKVSKCQDSSYGCLIHQTSIIPHVEGTM